MTSVCRLYSLTSTFSESEAFIYTEISEQGHQRVLVAHLGINTTVDFPIIKPKKTINNKNTRWSVNAIEKLSWNEIEAVLFEETFLPKSLIRFTMNQATDIITRPEKYIPSMPFVCS